MAPWPVIMMDQLDRPGKLLVDVDGGHLLAALAGELQQVGDKVAHPLRLLLDDLQGAPPGVVRGRAAQGRLDAQADRRQRVVQLVRDAGRQLAHAGEPGRLPQLLGHRPHFLVLRPKLGHRPLQVLLALVQRLLRPLPPRHVHDRRQHERPAEPA
jgi:hypothetical protein